MMGKEDAGSAASQRRTAHRDPASYSSSSGAHDSTWAADWRRTETSMLVIFQEKSKNRGKKEDVSLKKQVGSGLSRLSLAACCGGFGGQENFAGSSKRHRSIGSGRPIVAPAVERIQVHQIIKSSHRMKQLFHRRDPLIHTRILSLVSASICAVPGMPDLSLETLEDPFGRLVRPSTRHGLFHQLRCFQFLMQLSLTGKGLPAFGCSSRCLTAAVAMCPSAWLELAGQATDDGSSLLGSECWLNPFGSPRSEPESTS
ncbi:uncharacterized protein BJX67DRAFT_290485 [Aspergillus lucknowensis]|uniref:Uncharacterized protein n=1 Tax=Aspergillus lucknowensis TaxID=176173 RepID=A0ABR4LE39_9EURO